VEIPPACPPHEGTQHRGDQIQAEQHIKEPQVKAGLSQEHLIEGCPDALPAQAVHLYPFHQRIGRPPYRQGGGDTQHMAEKKLGGGEAVLGVQQEHAGEHDKHRHTPVGQPVVHVEHHKIGRSHRRRLQGPAGYVDHDHRQHGGTPQQIGVGQPAAYGLTHPLPPLRDELDPVAVRVLNEVNAHIRVFKAYAAHGPVPRQQRIKAVGDEGQMELLLPQIVGFGAVPQPG
jgi:hypothetical protein